MGLNRLARLVGYGDRAADQPDVEPGVLPGAPEPAPVDVPSDPEALREPIIAALRTVYDPEIPVNIYDLGLIYRIEIAADGAVEIDMTLTAPACPVAGTMPVLVQEAAGTVAGVTSVEVALVWDPPWDMAKMSEEARLELGMM